MDRSLRARQRAWRAAVDDPAQALAAARELLRAQRPREALRTLEPPLRAGRWTRELLAGLVEAGQASAVLRPQPRPQRPRTHVDLQARRAPRRPGEPAFVVPGLALSGPGARSLLEALQEAFPGSELRSYQAGGEALVTLRLQLEHPWQPAPGYAVERLRVSVLPLGQPSPPLAKLLGRLLRGASALVLLAPLAGHERSYERLAAQFRDQHGCAPRDFPLLVADPQLARQPPFAGAHLTPEPDCWPAWLALLLGELARATVGLARPR